MSGLLGPVTANRNLLAQALRPNRREFQMQQNTPQGLLDAAAMATAPAPILGDVMGLLADGNRFVNEPESRTPANFGLAALGLLPFVPSGVGAVKKMTQYEKAHEIAQRNAALPVEKGGLGLPPNNTAMDRAKAMGGEFGYTGTNRDITSYDSSLAGASGSGSREGPLGAWLTDDPRVASGFAEWSSRGLGGDTVYPLMIMGKNPAEIKNYSEIKDVLDANTQFTRPPYRMMQDKIDYEGARKQLQEKGDYVALRNTMTDAIDKPITQYLVTEPNRLRSRFAAFDPMRRNENNLLANVAPFGLAGLLGLGLYGGNSND